MRLLRPVLTAVFAILAIIAGLFAAALVAITGAGVMLARRLLRLGHGSAGATPQRTPARPASADEPIDVVATEVPMDSRRR